MKKNRLLRLAGIATIALLALVIGVKSTKAELIPSVELTNSVNNWSVQTGSQITLTARVVPGDYHTISRMEIRQGNTVLATCWNQNTCSTTVSVANGTNYLQGVGYDLDGRIIFSPIMSLVGAAQNNNNNVYGAPSVSVYASTYEVDPISNSGLSIESRATDNSVIRDFRIYRVEDWRLEATTACNNEPYNCFLRFYPSLSNADAGRTYTYEARATDAEGNIGYSSRITIRVRGTIGQNNNGNNQLPGVYLDRNTIPEVVNTNSAVSIRAESWDNEGLNRLSIYVTRQNYIGDGFTSNDSYQFPWKRHCYTTIYNLNCYLDISNFSGYEGQTFYVWAETVDQAGQRVVSNIYSMRVAGQVVTPPPANQKPGIYLDPNTIPSEVNLNSHVMIRADAWDNERLDRVEIYAQPRNYYGYGYNDYTGSVPRYTKTCYNTGTNFSCTLDIANFNGYEFAGRTFDVWARVIDAAGQTTYSKYYTMKVQGNVVNPPPANQKPGIYLDQNTIPAEVKSNATFNIRADAWDNERLSQVTIFVTPRNWYAYNDVYSYSGKTTFRRDCYTSGTNLSCVLDINKLQGYEGQTFDVWAVATDAAGQKTYSKSYTFKVLQPANVAPTVSVWTNVAEVTENKTLTVYGQAQSSTGVWGVEVRALPSWSNEAITRRCIMSNGSQTTGNCDLTVGPFPGHAGQTVKVWAIAWSSENGMGGSSDAKYITIKSNPKPNIAPTVNVTASQKNVNANQTVTFRANASDENGIEKIDLYVNARIVKTCTKTTACEYTGGPFSKYAGTSVSYAAKVWDTTGKSTWTGYDYLTVNRTVARRAATVRVASR